MDEEKKTVGPAEDREGDATALETGWASYQGDGKGPRERQSKKRREARAAARGLLWFAGYLGWLEIICRVGLFGLAGGRGLGYTILFSLAAGLLMGVLLTVGGERWRKVYTITLSALMVLWASAQSIYYTIFDTFLTLYSVGNGGEALQFWRDILAAMGKIWYVLVLLWAPFVAMLVRGVRPAKTGQWRWTHRVVMAGLAGLVQILAVTLVVTNTAGGMSPSYLYRYSFIPEKTAEEFGIFTTLRLDAKQLFFGVDEPPEEPLPTLAAKPTPVPVPATTPDGSQPPTEEPTPTPVVYQPNVMDIDFAALAETAPSDTLKSMHQWFGSREATMQNEYTGAWKDKNLIFIVAEGFARYAITPETTPTDRKSVV